MSHTTKATNATYLNTSRENMLEWKRAFDTICDKHPERLLSVVTNNKLHSSILLKYMTQYKQLKMTFEDDHDEILAEAQRSAYLILIDTIGDRQTLQTIERKFVNNASGAYNYILKMWEAKATDDRAVALDNKRADHIRQGAKSSSKRHMTEFVECLLQYNIELEGTAFEMMNETVVLHVLTALQKHNKALVTSYKAANAGKDDWNSDFDKVWDQLQLLLESDDLAEDANNDPTSADILKTNIMEDPRDALLRQLTEQVKTLTMAVQAVQGNMNEGKSILRTRAVQPQLATCMDCGYPHPRRGEHPCVGKALATGDINMDEAKLLFHNLNNPENAAINAKERYLAYQEKLKPTTPTSPKVIIPTKKVVLTTQVAQVHVPARECDNMNTSTKLKVDTCADITILNDPRFFKNGVDTKDTHTLETISLDMGPCTTGVGEAYVTTRDGTEICIEQAHLCTAARENVLATRNIASNAIPDLQQGHLRVLKDDIIIPFDAGYAAIFIRPTFDMELPQEHGLASEVKDTKDDEGPPWQLVKNKKNKKMHINQNTHVKQVNGPNITKRHGDNCQNINKCGMHTCG